WPATASATRSPPTDPRRSGSPTGARSRSRGRGRRPGPWRRGSAGTGRAQSAPAWLCSGSAGLGSEQAVTIKRGDGPAPALQAGLGSERIGQVAVDRVFEQDHAELVDDQV